MAKVRIKMDPNSRIIARHGMDQDGPVNLFLTSTVNRRIGRYMPHLAGYLETKAKRVASPSTIEVTAPYAKYVYYGRKMVDADTGRGPALIPDVGYRYRKGARLKPTPKKLHYTRTFNVLAGPHWERRMMAAEGDEIRDEVAAYIRRFD